MPSRGITMDQLINFKINIYFLIGLLIFLAASSVLLIVFWSILKAWLWRIRQRRRQKQYYKQTHRADGRRYPPMAQGKCDQCGSTSKKIYYTETGPKLCSECYEVFWREEAMRDGQKQGTISS